MKIPKAHPHSDSLGTDHLIDIFSSRFYFYFRPIENRRFFFFFFSQSESQNILFQDKAKDKIFFS